MTIENSIEHCRNCGKELVKFKCDVCNITQMGGRIFTKEEEEDLEGTIYELGTISGDRLMPMEDKNHLTYALKLYNSVKEKGIIDPLMVIKEDGRLVVRGGCTRLWAAQQLGIKDVPVIIITPNRLKNKQSPLKDGKVVSYNDLKDIYKAPIRTRFYRRDGILQYCTEPTHMVDEPNNTIKEDK